MDLNSLLSAEEAAARLHQAPASLAKWRSEGKGPRYLKIGRAVYYREADISEWLESRIVDPQRRRAA